MIRNLFFALVLANLALGAWTAWYADPPLKAATPRETGVPIRLIGEVGSTRADDGAARLAGGRADPMARLPETGGGDPAAGGSSEGVAPAGSTAPAESSSISEQSAPADRASAAAAPARAADAAEPLEAAGSDRRAASTASAASGCVSIGPYAEAEDAEAASAALQSAGYAPAQRSAEGEIWVGFWVHIDAIPSREEANAMLAQLRENGLPDAYLIPGEEDGDIISLGVFNNMTRAGRLDEQVRRIGLVPLIVERSRPGLVYWLDVSVAAGRALDLDALGIGQDRIEQLPCESAG